MLGIAGSIPPRLGAYPRRRINMKSHKISGGGNIQLHALETGAQRGRPILFLHGISQSSLAWNLQMNSSLADSHRLVAMDLRGHGGDSGEGER
jgi:pimeloyl-ACP methyl ester carboxylesterase